MTLAAGSRLGPYEIVGPIGAGGMGEVWKARDTRLSREVAIKVLPEKVASDPEALARFEREAKAVAALSHPNVLGLFDLGKEGETAYAVTELLIGETLRQRLQEGALPQRKALEFPLGKVVFETDGWVSHPRISPDGTRVAFLEHPGYGNDDGFVSTATLAGRVTRVTGEWQGAQGLAWSRDGKEIWFTGGNESATNGSRYQLWAVSPGGKPRLVYGPPMDIWLDDISSTGAVLLSGENARGEIGGLLKGDTKERDLSTWSDEAVSGIAQDGSAYTGIEQSAPGAGLEPFLYYRRADEAAPVRLGSGTSIGLSPDGRWVASRTGAAQDDARLTLLPTGPGDPRPLPTGNVRPRAVSQEPARWSPDGRLFLFSGSEPGRSAGRPSLRERDPCPRRAALRLPPPARALRAQRRDRKSVV